MAVRFGADLALAHLLLDQETHPLYQSNIEQVFELASLDVNGAINQAVRQPLAPILEKLETHAHLCPDRHAQVADCLISHWSEQLMSKFVEVFGARQPLTINKESGRFHVAFTVTERGESAPANNAGSDLANGDNDAPDNASNDSHPDGDPADHTAHGTDTRQPEPSESSGLSEMRDEEVPNEHDQRVYKTEDASASPSEAETLISTAPHASSGESEDVTRPPIIAHTRWNRLSSRTKRRIWHAWRIKESVRGQAALRACDGCRRGSHACRFYKDRGTISSCGRCVGGGLACRGGRSAD